MRKTKSLCDKDNREMIWIFDSGKKVVAFHKKRILSVKLIVLVSILKCVWDSSGSSRKMKRKRRKLEKDNFDLDCGRFFFVISCRITLEIFFFIILPSKYFFSAVSIELSSKSTVVVSQSFLLCFFIRFQLTKLIFNFLSIFYPYSSK